MTKSQNPCSAKRSISTVAKGAKYEAAFLKHMSHLFPKSFFEVKGTENGVVHTVTGKSGEKRQLDVAVYRDDKLILFADTKNHSSNLPIGHVDQLYGVMADVGCPIGVLIGPKNFTKGAVSRAPTANVTLKVFSRDEMLRAQLREDAKKYAPYDWAFHDSIANAILGIFLEKDWDEVADCLYDVCYEEWLDFVDFALDNHTAEATFVLKAVLVHHYDDAWRYNAFSKLYERNLLSREEIVQTMDRELHDPDFRELFEDLGPMSPPE